VEAFRLGAAGFQGAAGTDNRHVEISTSPLSGVSENKFHLVFGSSY
jgi:hypothetical protein